jgi:hypothetical protein
MTDTMELLNIEKDRASQDNCVNNFGYSLIDFCISQRLLIMNGRVGRDAGVGKMTCKNASVVDYMLGSPSLFPRITDFFVNDFDECLSDVHCALCVCLDINY